MSRRAAPATTASHVTTADSRAPLPSRYNAPWKEPFQTAIAAQLREGATILDVGSGRNPTVASDQRPPGVRYIGIDLSAEELAAAGDLAYDQLVVADIATPVPYLVDSIDLAVSWQVFEHIESLDVALSNLNAYLREDGVLISLFSGRWSVFGAINRVLPNAVGVRLVEFSMRRRGTGHPAFPAYYDRCTDRSLRSTMSGWSHVEIHALYRGATYFHFSPTLTRAYLAYENTARRAGLKDLATHYLLIARR